MTKIELEYVMRLEQDAKLRQAENAALTALLAELADVLDEADFMAQNPAPPEADRHNLRLRIMAARDAIKEQA